MRLVLATAICATSLTFASEFALAQLNSTIEQPVEPPPIVKCLTNPKCGPRLFVGPTGARYSPQSPVDGSKNLPCFLDPKCRNSLGVRPDIAMAIQRPTQAWNAPQRPVASRVEDGSIVDCTAAVMGADHVITSIHDKAGFGRELDKTAIAVALSAYTAASKACGALAAPER